MLNSFTASGEICRHSDNINSSVDWLQFHQCVKSYVCSQSNSDGSVLSTLKQSHQS